MIKLSTLLLSLVISTQTLSNEDLCYSYTSGTYKECQNFDNKDFSFQNLDRKDWIGASLVGANLEGASLEMAFLSKADLSYANMRDINAYAIKLHKANLYQADLRGADLRGASLVGADLSHAITDENTLFNGAVYSRTTTKLPLSWGTAPMVKAHQRGMNPLREDLSSEKVRPQAAEITTRCMIEPENPLCDLGY